MRRRTTRSEHELLDDAVDELGRSGAFALVFGGLSGSTGLRISSLRGHRTPLLAGLHVELRRGLGGRSMIEQRPRIANDYRSSRVITHDYDRQVLGEGVRTLLAVPVIVDGVVRGVLYGARREDCALGGVAVRPAVDAAVRLQRALTARDEAERMRLGLRAGEADPGIPAGHLEELRAGYAELRAIAARVEDPELLERLRRLEQRLANLSGAGPGQGPDEGPPVEVHLSPRELDVLGHVALGLRNAEAARELGLSEATVKSYLAAAMRKLDQRSRHGAVAAARRLGLLP